uniref:TPR repeat-containing protein n=1 Tax=Solibacter usitatus (strain Ellin6076) TaxID=234267 RepID=Q01QH2_SOLUE
MAKKHSPQKRAGAAPGVLAPEAPLLRGQAERFVPAAIVVLGVLSYLNSLHTPFIFDDRYHIVENLRIRHLWPPWEILTHSSRPVIHLSLALNYALGGLDPWGYHAFNICIHVLAALVLYGIVRATFLSDSLRHRWARVATPLAGMIAALWLVHPIQTESVTYTIQRGESLMGLFYLLTLYCVIRLHNSSRGKLWGAAAIACCLFGMSCKGVMATAPIVVLLYDRTFLSSSWAELAQRRKGLYLGLAATWLVYPLLLSQAPEEWKDSAGFNYAGLSPFQYAITQPSVILHYLRLAFWPSELCLDYGWPPVKGIGDALAPGIVICALILAFVWAWRRNAPLGFFGIWFFLILIPTSSFIPIADLAVEHRMYLSLAAVIALAVTGLAALSQRRAAKEPIRIPAAGWVACALVIAVFTALTIRRNSDYSSMLTMWESTVRTSPGNPRAHYDFGVSLEGAGQTQPAIAQYQTAIQLNPGYSEALNNLGHALLKAGKPSDSVVYLQRAIAIKPSLPETHTSLATALAQIGKFQEAEREFAQALRLNPDYEEAHNNLGILLSMEHRPTEAIEHWTQALRLNPAMPDTHTNIATALTETGSIREALAHYDQALRIQPDYLRAQIGMAKLLATAQVAQGGDPVRAVAIAERACQLTGNRDPVCLDTLAISYAAANRFDDALKTGQAALQLAGSQGLADLSREIEAHLQFYRAHRR